jgi:hypothetical protein
MRGHFRMFGGLHRKKMRGDSQCAQRRLATVYDGHIQKNQFRKESTMQKMKANVFHGANNIRIEEVPRPIAGLWDYKIVTTLCSSSKERMRRLMSVVQSKRFDPTPLLTHRFKLDEILEAYDPLSSRRDGVLKVAIQP